MWKRNSGKGRVICAAFLFLVREIFSEISQILFL